MFFQPPLTFDYEKNLCSVQVLFSSSALLIYIVCLPEVRVSFTFLYLSSPQNSVCYEHCPTSTRIFLRIKYPGIFPGQFPYLFRLEFFVSKRYIRLVRCFSILFFPLDQARLFICVNCPDLVSSFLTFYFSHHIRRRGLQNNITDSDSIFSQSVRVCSPFLHHLHLNALQISSLPTWR